MRTRQLLTMSLPLLLTACLKDPAPHSPVEPVRTESIETARDSGATSAAAATERSCETRIAEASLIPPDSRQRDYLEGLPFVLIAAPAEPVIYLRWPEVGGDSRSEAIRDEIAASRRSRRALRAVVRRHRNAPALLRGALLRDGYLTHDDPAIARALVQEVALEDLFASPEIYRQRGDEVVRLIRATDGYVDADGEAATLILNDRVAAERAALADPLHLSITAVREETGALRTIPVAFGDSAAALELHFPDGTIRPALVERSGDATTVACVGGAPETLAATVAHARRFWERHRRVVEAAERFAVERPRFDEPIGEPEGVQEDGQLRLAWRQAYYAGLRRFTYRDVEYPVYDHRGNPLPPQVCVDLVFDTWERAAGRWYRPRGHEPGCTEPREDLSAFDGVPRRSIAGVLAHASENEGILDRHDFGRNERAPLRREAAMAQTLAAQSQHIREGDALIIHGIREQDGRAHFHSALVIHADPLTGVPVVVADNQGRPRLGSLVQAMRAAPRRSIKHRIRLDLDTLERS